MEHLRHQARRDRSLPSEIGAAPKSITLSIYASQPNAVGEARDALADCLREWKLSDDHADDVLLCCSELLSNVARHVSPPTCVLCLEGGATVRLVVRDSSSDLPRVRDGRFMAESGRGLILINALASRWGADLTLDGKVVWVEFDTSPTEATACGEGKVRWSA